MKRIASKCIIAAAALFFGCLSTANSAPITLSFNDIDIGGTPYNATFHVGGTFLSIWDPDRDAVFGEDDGAVVNHAPAFWGDRRTAILAAKTLLDLLGTTGTWNGSNDGFYIPYDYSSSANLYVGILYDANPAIRIDNLSGDVFYSGVSATKGQPNQAWVSFEYAAAATTEIPEPPLVAVQVLAGVVLMTVARTRRLRTKAKTALNDRVYTSTCEPRSRRDIG